MVIHNPSQVKNTTFMLTLCFSFLVMNISLLNNTHAQTKQTSNRIWITSSIGKTNDLILTDVRIINPESAVGAIGFDISYCSEMLEYLGYERGDITETWPFMGCNMYETGFLRIGGFCYPPVPLNSSGSIIRLIFRVTCTGCTNGETCLLHIYNLTDDLEYWNSDDGIFTYYNPSLIPTLDCNGVLLLLTAFGMLFFKNQNHKKSDKKFIR